MNELKIKTPAKVNLCLDVTGKKENGYHTIKTIFQTVSLYDIITIYQGEEIENFKISCNVSSIPCDKNNIVWKAVELLENSAEFRFSNQINIDIQKSIPSMAGLGGGSSDAAAVIYGLCKMFDIRLSYEEKCEIAFKCGADVPFFLYGGTCLAENFGETLKPIPNNCGNIPICIAKGSEGVSTANGYKCIDEMQENGNIRPYGGNRKAIKDALYNGCIQGIAKNLGNVFSDAVKLPEVSSIKNFMKHNGALNAEMTGSGSAVFGIFRSIITAKNVANVLSESYFAKSCYMGDFRAEII